MLRIMSSFKLFRITCQIVGIMLGLLILIFCVADRMVCARIGVIFLILDLILIAIKNRCPFCHKSLRIGPIRGEEYCPYCGSKIE